MIITILLASFVLLAFVHMSYVYVMGLKRARDKGTLSKWVYPFAIPTVAIMLPFYFLLNITLGSLLFLELPKTLQFTSRVNRHIRENSWRGKQARFWCDKFLDPYEEGGHCLKSKKS